MAAIKTKERIDRPSRTEEDRLVREIVEAERFYVSQLQEGWNAETRYWKLYLAKREDHRGPNEKWRANVFLPYPYQGVEARVAQLVDSLTSADPMLQAEGVGDEDYESARHGERLLDYTTRGIQFPKLLTTIARAASIQGTDFYKSVWAERSHVITLFPTAGELESFDKAIQDVIASGVLPPPDFTMEPEKFAEWRKMVNDGGKIKVPEPPYEGRRKLIKYRGPWIERIPSTDLRYDPLIQEVQDQHCFIHRVIKPASWVEARTGSGEDKPFDPEAVKDALTGWSGEQLNEFRTEQAELLGITSGSAQDPYFEDSVEIWEVWRLRERYPFLVILNQKRVINKRPAETPFVHGENSITAVRNVLVPGYLRGISELQQPEALYYEAIALRNLRLDAVTLATLPVFSKLRDVGVPEVQRKLVPGGMVDVSRPDAIKRLMDSQIPNEAYREIEAIKAEIDETNATGPNVRGATSTIGRVSATESQGRLNQSLTRMKLAAVLIDSDMSPSVRQWLALWYQFAPADLREQVGGMGDNLAAVDKSKLLEAMQYDYRFRGATRALDRALLTQQLNEFGDKWRDLLAPPELRALMKQVFETMGLKGVTRIVSDQYTKLLTMQFMAQLAQPQGQPGAQPGQPGAAPAGPEGVPPVAEGEPPVPPSVPLAEAQAMTGQEGEMESTPEETELA